MILGGFDESDSSSRVVEEIDFLKRNIVNLANLNSARVNASAFVVNDNIYVVGGSNQTGLIGEKYTLSENRWRDLKPKSL
jgi:hypothetical protein